LPVAPANQRSTCWSEIECFVSQATAKSTGERCRQPAIPGGWICSDHGVNKAVRAKAEARIAALVTPALRTIAALLDPRRRWDHPTVALRAAEDALELNDMWPGKGTKKAGGLSLPSLPAGTTSATFTASVKVETLTDAEIETMKQILEKMGAGLALKTIDVDPVPQP